MIKPLHICHEPLLLRTRWRIRANGAVISERMQVTIALHTAPHRAVSLALVAQALPQQAPDAGAQQGIGNVPALGDADQSGHGVGTSCGTRAALGVRGRVSNSCSTPQVRSRKPASQ